MTSRPPKVRPSPRPAGRLLFSLVWAVGVGCVPWVSAQPVPDSQVLRNPLTPRTLAQALAVRNLELAYGRESVAIGQSLATAEAAL